VLSYLAYNFHFYHEYINLILCVIYVFLYMGSNI
jgi:hypothetical protein